MGKLASYDFTATNNGSTITWVTSNEVNITRSSSSTWLKGNVGKSTGVMVFQSYISWGANANNEDVCGIKLTSATLSNSAHVTAPSASITSREASGGEFRASCGFATWNAAQDVDSNVTKGKDVKIVYDTSDNSVKQYYWNGSSWTQFGSTQTVNLLNGGTVYPYIISVNTAGTDNGPLNCKDIYWTTGDYSTQYPTSPAPLNQSVFSLTNNGSTIGFASTALTITRPTTMTWEVTGFSKNSNLVIGQANMTWGTDVIGDIGFMAVCNSTTPTSGYHGPSSRSAGLGTRSNTTNSYRLRAGDTASNLYDVEVAVTKGKDVKIVYDTSANSIKYYYWNGSSWTQMGTTQTYNILNGGSMYLMLGYQNTSSNIGTLTFDNIYFDSYASDYTTQYPSGGSLAKSGFFQFFA
jgi:hypothetical protein